VLRLVQEREGMATAREVAEGVGVSVKTARRYLNRLAVEGKVRWSGEGWMAQ
jgi:DNA-binding IclR family transcriptional regulator